MASGQKFWKPGTNAPNTANVASTAAARAEAASAPPASSDETSKTTRVEKVTKLSSKLTGMRFMAKVANDDARKVEEQKKEAAKAESEWSLQVAPPNVVAAAVLESATRAAAAEVGVVQPSQMSGVKRKRLLCVTDEDSTVLDSATDNIKLIDNGALVAGRRSYKSYNKILEATVKKEVQGEAAKVDLSEEEMKKVLLKRGHGDGAEGGKGRGGGGKHGKDPHAMPRKLR